MLSSKSGLITKEKPVLSIIVVQIEVVNHVGQLSND